MHAICTLFVYRGGAISRYQSRPPAGSSWHKVLNRRVNGDSKVTAQPKAGSAGRSCGADSARILCVAPLAKRSGYRGQVQAVKVVLLGAECQLSDGALAPHRAVPRMRKQAPTNQRPNLRRSWRSLIWKVSYTPLSLCSLDRFCVKLCPWPQTRSAIMDTADLENIRIICLCSGVQVPEFAKRCRANGSLCKVRKSSSN